MRRVSITGSHDGVPYETRNAQFTIEPQKMGGVPCIRGLHARQDVRRPAARLRREVSADRDNRAHTIKSLCYFEDAEREPPPKLLAPVAWDDVKTFFLSESRRLASRWL